MAILATTAHVIGWAVLAALGFGVAMIPVLYFSTMRDLGLGFWAALRTLPAFLGLED
jgi:hypothetical protein